MKDTPKFEFNKEEHYYTLDGKRMYGVTNVLGVIAKPALIPWAVKMATDYIKDHANKIFHEDNFLHYEVTEGQLEEAKSAHRKKKEDAGTKGTDVHAIVEGLIKDAISTNLGFIKAEGILNDNKQVSNFCNWATQNEIKFLVSEKMLFSETMWLAGTTDMVFEMKGQKFVGDVKTSSGIYPEMFYQCAAYRMMLEEMGEKDFVGSVIINLKKDGKFNEEKDVQFHYDYELDKSAFLGALALFKANEQYKITK